MTPALSRLYQEYKYGLPFIILFITSLCLHTASHRIMFYALAPILIGTIYSLRAEIRDYLKTKSFAVLGVYLLFFAVSYFWSGPYPDQAFGKTLRDTACITIFSLSLAMVIPRLKFPESAPFYFAALIAGWAVLATFNYYIMNGHSLETRLEGLGRYKNSIHMAFLLSVAILLLISRHIKHHLSWKKKAMDAFLILIFLLLIALTQTRSAYLALAACVGMMVVLGHVRHIAIVLFGIAVGFIGLYCVSDSYFNIFISRLDSYRLTIWIEAFEGFLQRPWIGHGIGYVPAFAPEIPDPKSGWKSTHNAFLGHVFTGGIIGGLLLIGMVLHMCRYSIVEYLRLRKMGAQASYMLILTCLMVCFGLSASLVNFTHYLVNVHIQWLVIWVPFALVWAIEVGTAKERRLS